VISITGISLIRNYYQKKNKIKNNKNNSSENENFIKIEEEKYTPSNLLDILGVQENVKISPNKFKIKQDFLSRPDVVEINMIQNDLAFKMGIINKELDSILQQYGKKIYKLFIDSLSSLLLSLLQFFIFDNGSLKKPLHFSFSKTVLHSFSLICPYTVE